MRNTYDQSYFLLLNATIDSAKIGITITCTKLSTYVQKIYMQLLYFIQNCIHITINNYTY